MTKEPKYGESARLKDLVAAADDSVKAALASGKGLGDFLTTIDKLDHSEMNTIVEQAIIMLEAFYVHLPLKRAMHAVEPLQSLRLLQRRLPQITSEIAFHHAMTEIFTSLRDLHTNYILPIHFARMVAYLPFRVESYVDGQIRKYIASPVVKAFRHPTFVTGVEIRYWSGIPIERAVELAAACHAGSNPEARHARGVAALTKRAMNISPPPDEEWVTIAYKGLDEKDYEIRIDWTISDLPSEMQAGVPELSSDVAASFGLDLEGDTFQRINKMLFAQDIIAAKRNIETVQSAAIASSGSDDPDKSAEIGAAAAEAVVTGTESTLPDVFAARAVTVGGRQYAYIRIKTFQVASDVAFIDEFSRLISLNEMPKDGLILDVRGNGGGLIWAGERLLQLLTPRIIEPCRFQFINTAANLQLCQSAAAFNAWAPSLLRALETGATFSASFPVTDPKRCNDIGQRYYGPVVLITDARCYSTTDIFAAGFRDHEIGTILGVDGNTGAGGANVWTLGDINRFFSLAGLPPALKGLPKGAGMRVAIRRTLRVGPEAGTELEDLGVLPHERHNLTRNDLLNDNVDLIARAAALLARKPIFDLRFELSKLSNDDLRLKIHTKGIGYVDVSLNGRSFGSRDVVDDRAEFDFTTAPGAKIELRGFSDGRLVSARRFSIETAL